MKISIDATGQDPIYKQIVKVIEKAVREQKLAPGQQVESMNELADRLNISKETVKKAYGILVEKGTERTALPDFSPSMGKVRDLLERMFRGFVTPVSARDVAEDWLLE